MHPRAAEVPPSQEIPGVSNVIAVGSGKGGVGKTTVAVNLAIALSRLGLRTGLLDADVYGPNIPLMLGIRQAPFTDGQRIIPIEKEGLKLMSMGFLQPGDKPLVWRGPMLHSVMQQFLRQTAWEPLDYLVVDLPPGTGDVALSLVQIVPLTGAVIVTTPSEVAVEDARKAVNMFRNVHVPVLGLVENMSYLIAPQSRERVDVFGAGGGKGMAEEMKIDYLGELPLDPAIRVGGDTGKAVAWNDFPEFVDLARKTIARVEALSHRRRRITVED
jgi:ATP-binding protein involved in chromosome partitioning